MGEYGSYEVVRLRREGLVEEARWDRLAREARPDDARSLWDRVSEIVGLRREVRVEEMGEGCCA